MTEFKVGDKVVVVDDSDGTQSPVKEYCKEVKETKLVKDKKTNKRSRVKTGKMLKVKVPAILEKGKTYKVKGVSQSGLILLDLPKPYDYDWWRASRFQKKGK